MKLLTRSRIAFIALVAASTSSVLSQTHINPGTVRWANAARSGRADILFIGDSIANFGSGGWSNGFAQAAMNGIGLAGTGIQMVGSGPGETIADYTGARVFASQSFDSVATGIAPLSPSGRNYEVGPTFNFLGAGIDSAKMDQTKAIDWHVFAVGTSPTSGLGARRNKMISSPFSSTTIQSAPYRAVTSSMQDHVFHFDAMEDVGDWNTFSFTPESNNAAIYYTKLVEPEATGVAVSGWGRGGATTEYFRQNLYNHSRFTAQARTEYLRALVAGNSGKLNVAVTFGVNDANQTFSTSSYEASIRGIIADVRRDWLAAGLDMADLSFTLPSAYQVNSTLVPPAVFQRLNDYRAVLRAIAQADESVSFVDIWGVGPTSAEAVAHGYLSDALHPSALGTQVYGQLLMDQLLPDLGDANIDGHVNFDDLLLLAQSYGDSGSWSNGDFNGTGLVDFDDLLILAQKYDPQSFRADWVLATSFVPEPSLLTCGALFAIFHRRRGRQLAS